MKCLVTGGAGFIGSVLCTKLLEQGHKVHCLDNFNNSNQRSLVHLSKNKDFSFQYFDVSNYYLTKNWDFDVIFHLAGLVGFPNCANKQRLSEIWNIESTSQIVELAERTKSKLIFASTGSVYGALKDICTEESETNPVSAYGVHKLKAEKIVKMIPDSISLRFATGYGVSYSPRFDLLINNLVFDALKNRVLTIFEPEVKRTFISVDQMAEAFIYCMNNYEKSKHQVYNCGSEELNLTKQQIVDKIAEHVPFQKFYVEGKDLDMRNYEVSYQRIKEFGFFVKNTLDEDIQNLIKLSRMYL